MTSPDNEQRPEDPRSERLLPAGHLRHYVRERLELQDKHWLGDDDQERVIVVPSHAQGRNVSSDGHAQGPTPAEGPPPSVEMALRDPGPSMTGGSNGPPRFFNARSPDQVLLGTSTYVHAQVSTESWQASRGNAADSASVGDFVGTLTVDVYAPGLSPAGPTTLELQVPRSGNSAPIRFAFIANIPGTHRIDVMAWNGSAHIAGLTLQVVVGEQRLSVDLTTNASTELNVREPVSGEYTLDVAFDVTNGRYRFQFRGEKVVWEPMHSEPLVRGISNTYESLRASIDSQVRNRTRLDDVNQALWLKGMGAGLFKDLIPAPLQVLLVEHRRNIRILNIFSNGDSTPWELLYILDPNSSKGGAFLADSVIVARWQYGAASPTTLRRKENALVFPEGAPANAHDELKRIQTLLGSATIVESLSGLNALLERGEFDVLHFAAHNVAVPSATGSGAYIVFGDQPWSQIYLGALSSTLRSRGPLVFMNACTTASTSEAYTQMVSWATLFLDLGCGAFIGTLFEVRSASAAEFADTFYQAVTKGKTLGEAMQEARRAIRLSKPGDPSALAYTLYGNAFARLEQP